MKSFFPAILVVFLAGLFTNTAFARSPNESDFVAAEITGEEVSGWIQSQPKPLKSIGIFSIHVSLPLEQEFAAIMESEITKGLRNMSSLRVVTCEECRTPQVQVKGDRLVITKGAPELEVLRNLGRKLEVESFLTLDVYRTQLSLITEANLYDSGSGQIIATEQFKVPTFDVGDASAQIILKFGPGFGIGGKDTSGTGSSTPPLGGELQFLEELGFGKGGISIGGAGSNAGGMWFVMPTLAWRGRIGASGLSTLKGFGVGFGESGSTFGVSGGLFYDLFIGSFTSIGVQAVGVFPTSSTNNESSKGLQGFIGLTIGFSLGR